MAKLHRMLFKLWYVLAIFIILFALLVSVMRVLTPYANAHISAFEQFASNTLKMPVKIGSINLDWHEIYPQITFHKVTVYDPTTHTPKLAIGGVRVNFDVLKTLWIQRPYIHNLTVGGIFLKINQEDPNIIRLGEITSVNVKDAMTEANVEADNMVKWIFSQRRLALQNIQLLYTYKDMPERSITIRYLSLKNDDDEHRVRGRARINQSVATNIKLEFNWKGDVRNLMATRGHIHIILDNFSIAEWLDTYFFYGLQFQQGVGDAELWMDWLNNQPTNISCVFDVNGLKIYSSVTKRQKTISLLEGNIKWKQEGNIQEISGNQANIYFSDHHWAPIDFNIRLNTDDAGNYSLGYLKLSYFDLTDALHLLMDTTLLSEDLKDKLQALDPQGEVNNVEATFPPNMMTDETFDYANLNLSVGLKNFSVKAWNSLPSIANFTGDIKWNGNEAQINLESKDLLVNIPQVFSKPFHFNNANGYAEFWNHDGTWMVSSEKLHVDNADLTGDANFSLSLPQDNTAAIDLKAAFTLKRAAGITRYLPDKFFDKELNDWLSDAFLAGKADGVTVVVQGPLADFPYDTKPGKFLITGKVKDVELNYGNDWPRLKHLNGDLTFSGAQMIANVTSGDIMGVPLKNIKAVIPYIGETEPQVVDVQGEVTADLAQGLSFINNSPLKETIGKSLENISITGPMQLKLNLSIPVAKLEETKVLGVINTTNATVNMPVWKLALHKLTGTFQFTQDSLQATNMSATFFDSPAMINITTAPSSADAKNNIINISLATKISVPSIEKWLTYKLDKVLRGQTDAVVDVIIPTAEKDNHRHAVVTTNLVGVEVKAPAPFGKDAKTEMPFKADVALNESPAIVKINYGKVLSAALTLKTSKDNLVVHGGEIRIGSGDAGVSSAQGVLITGSLPQIDVTMWQKYFESLRDKTSKKYTAEDLKMLRGVDMSTNALIMPSLTLHDVFLKANYANGNWNVNGRSKEISGMASIPSNLRSQIRGTIAQINIDSFDTKAKSNLDPRTIPGLHFDVNNIHFGEFNISRVSIETINTSSGMSIRNISINDGVMNFTATGNWEYHLGRSLTTVEGKFSTQNITQVLKNWGFRSPNLVGTTANAVFKLNWDETPYGLDLKTLDGNLSIKLGPGSIVHLSESSNAKIGLGRLLNVLSLTSLPSTLSASRTFDKGYVFESMQADFNIQNGNLNTDNMKFTSPIAGVSIKGRIGLANKDLGLQMNVTPYVTGSLPVVAAFAGGPIVGIGALLVDKMISASNIITYHYDVTGPWSDPNWATRGTSPGSR